MLGAMDEARPVGRRLPGVGRARRLLRHRPGGRAGPGLHGVRGRAARLVAPVVRLRRAPHRGTVPTPRRNFESVGPPARGAGGARHAGRRPRPRDQQPGRRRPRGRSTRSRRRSETLMASLGRLAPGADHRRAVRRARRAATRGCGRRRRVNDSLAVADREETLSDWLAAHGVERDWLRGATAGGRGGDVAWCERVVEVLGEGDALEPGLEWVASTRSAMTTLLGRGARTSTRRISELVAAVRSYSQLDRASLQRDRRHRGAREHAGDAGATGCGDGVDGGARLRRRRTARSRPSRRAEPGLDEPHRQRRRRDGRPRDAAGDAPAVDGHGWVGGGRPTPARGCRTRCGPTRSSRSTRPRRSARAPVWASTSRAGSWSSGTAGEISIDREPR